MFEDPPSIPCRAPRSHRPRRPNKPERRRGMPWDSSDFLGGWSQSTGEMVLLFRRRMSHFQSHPIGILFLIQQGFSMAPQSSYVTAFFLARSDMDEGLPRSDIKDTQSPGRGLPYAFRRILLCCVCTARIFLLSMASACLPSEPLHHRRE